MTIYCLITSTPVHNPLRAVIGQIRAVCRVAFMTNSPVVDYKNTPCRPPRPDCHSLKKMMQSLLSVAAALLASGCVSSPSLHPPTLPEVLAYKEMGDWVLATPLDTPARTAWWQVFNDPVLSELAARVEVSNPTVAAAVAAYAQAKSVMAEQRASLQPSVTLATGTSQTSGGRSASSAQASLGASWEPDVWGRLQSAANANSAIVQASAADLAAATLSAQGALVVNYLSLRQQDAQHSLLANTRAGYAQALGIAQNRYNAGIAARTDVLQAQTQLANAQADEAGVQRTRAQLEHAIAVLVGRAPAHFTLTAMPEWTPTVPDVPVGVPSTLLQRRPDIAAVQHRMSSANAQIGVAKAAYYPSFSLNASTAISAGRWLDLLNAPVAVWSLGVSAAQVLLNRGALHARVDGATAAYEQTVARYRQTVLAALQNVEDQLAASRALQIQHSLRVQACTTADQAEQRVLNRYRSGQVGYAEVIAAQTTALSARRALVQNTAERQTTAAVLIQALGGGWQTVQ